jgi:hypothetical protein
LNQIQRFESPETFVEIENNDQYVTETYGDDIFDNFSIKSNEENSNTETNLQCVNENFDDFSIADISRTRKSNGNNFVIINGITDSGNIANNIV